MPNGLLIATAQELGKVAGMEAYPASVVNADGNLFFLGYRDVDKVLGIMTRVGEEALNDFDGVESSTELQGRPVRLRLCPLTSANVAALRAPALAAPQAVGSADVGGLR